MHLLRAHAPITETGWKLIDEEARQRVTVALAARKLVDFSGPLGWEHSATNLGRTEAIERSAAQGVRARQRRILAMVELRADFGVSRMELEDADRGALDIELDQLADAAREIALAENVAVFHGWPEAGIVGMSKTSPHPVLTLGDDFDGYPSRVAKAVETLLSAGVSGPYGLALSPQGYTGVVETTEHGGYLLFDHLRKILGGPIVWAPGVQGAVVVSLRGGDFSLETGQDLSVGYDRCDSEQVYLYIEESFSFRVVSPEAAVALT